MSYLDELNEPQRAAVEYIDGPALVIAGAGSGKTRVLTYKIMHLLQSGYKPWNILAITFTNKAAREMKERIAKKIGEESAAKLNMGTFHSVFMRILRREAKSIPPYQSNFTIYDQNDAKNVVKGILKDMKLDEKKYPVNDVCSRISKAKNHLITAEQYGASEFYADDTNNHKTFMKDIYMRYVNKCRSANAMDFDDLLLQTYFLLANNPDIVKKYSNYFTYILVDEYQDTNAVQYNIVKLLGSLHHKVFVVGDDAQSIYSFRGAQIENILNFQKDYRESKLFKLEQNYRSTQTIVNAANSVIRKNEKQIPKNTFSENEVGAKINVLTSDTSNDEGFEIADDIRRCLDNEEGEYKDFAILYRTNSQSRILEDALRKRSIPYRIYGGMSFYQRQEIKDFVAYLRLLINRRDNEALNRVVNYPKRGIGDTTMEKVSAIAAQNNISYWEVMEHLRKYDSGISPRTINAIDKFIELINDLSIFSKSNDAYQVATEVANRTGMLKELFEEKNKEKSTDASRYDNLTELFKGIKDYVETVNKETNNIVTIDDYLQEVSLLTGDEQKNDDPNIVTLMTIHASKGLEFKNVYIAGVEEGMFPSAKSVMSSTELEEERRLFYVAVTRAQCKLTLSYSHIRFKWKETIPNVRPSRFMMEIDSKYLNFGVGGESMFKAGIDHPFGLPRHPNSLNKIAEENRLKKLSSFKFSATKRNDADAEKFKEGVEIQHATFGRGRIATVTDSPNGKQIVVNFTSVGRKVLLLKYTLPNLKIIEN